MLQHAQRAHAEEGQHPVSPQHIQERKQRVLTKQTPSVVRSIADAVVIKDDDPFFLTEPDGSVPLDEAHGFGLYYHDCRFLNGYELKIAGVKPAVLASTAARGNQAVFQLTNPDLRLDSGPLIRKEYLQIEWQRAIDGAHLALYDVISLENFELKPVTFPLSFTFRAAFEDVFAVRGLLPEKLGTARPPVWQEDTLSLIYDGADGLYRSLTVAFDPPPQATDATTAHFQISLEPRGRTQLLVTLLIAEASTLDQVQPQAQHRPDRQHVEAVLQRSADPRIGQETQVHSDSLLVHDVIERSLRDLGVLESTLEDQPFFAAGVPWFATLFGRDSLITALQTLAYMPQIAEHTVRLLAKYQGQQVDEWRDEQPGKILHELRVGELARLNEIPQGQYYGTIDATLLFLIVIGHHAAWTGDVRLFQELRSHVDRALAWIAAYGDLNNDGYVAYQSASDKGLINQGWKDSGDAIVNADGSLARPPIALVEVQGYVYLAKRSLADLFERSGEHDEAARLRREAEQLRARFNRDFWLEDKGFYALALQADHQPAAVVSSNPGQALWTGIVDPDKAQRTVEALMADDMFNGWGVRTLSTQERRYNPLGYHLGTVWPHDNAIIAAGFRRYGFDDAFQRIFMGIVQASLHFDTFRLPELFAGFARTDYGIPVRYPVACHPQAWAAGAVPYLLQTALGLVPDAFAQRLRIVRPILPEATQYLEFRGLKVGSARVDLRFERTAEGVSVSALHVEGALDVVVEPNGALP
jgi:glycogen debranching enzyme